MKTISQYPIAILGLTLALSIGASGCLKTRAQLKDDDSSEASEKNSHGGNGSSENHSGGYALDEIKGEITRMTGRIEDLERAKQHAGSGPTSEDLKKLETRIIELEQSQLNMIDAMKKMQEEQKSNPSNLLDEAKKNIGNEDYSAAIKNLEQYVRSNGPEAEEANFLLGESYFQMRQYKKAIVPYARVQEKFGKSKKIPKVLERIASCFEALEMKADARAFWEQLADQYPKTPEGREAAKHLGRKKIR